VLLAGAALVGILGGAKAGAAQGVADCQSDQALSFDARLVPLSQQLGGFMGSPTECPHVDESSGDTLQETTTGLAYVVAGSDTPVFTDGHDHVALTRQGLIGWDGGSVDAPLGLTAPGGDQPTFCAEQTYAETTNGYLCTFGNNSVIAWAQIGDGSQWQILGTEAAPGAPWMLTSAGRSVLRERAIPSGPVVQPPTSVATPAPAPTAPPVLPPPTDSDLRVSLNPVAPSASVLLTGSACNASRVYVADNVEIDFAFVAANGLSTTPDHASYSIDRLAPGSCAQIVTSINSVYPWQSVEVSDTRVNWQPA
jgi:hypothetical protein